MTKESPFIEVPPMTDIVARYKFDRLGEHFCEGDEHHFDSVDGTYMARVLTTEPYKSYTSEGDTLDPDETVIKIDGNIMPPTDYDFVHWFNGNYYQTTIWFMPPLTKYHGKLLTIEFWV